METWRDIDGYDGHYSVSDHGRLRSNRRVVERVPGIKSTLSERILKQTTSGDGYARATLYKSGVPLKKAVHLFVLAAFVGECPPGMEGCHENGNKADPRLSNLRWDTHAANMADKGRHGTDLRGERVGNSKLKPADVLHIRTCGGSQSDIATAFGIDPSHVSRIRSGDVWAHI